MRLSESRNRSALKGAPLALVFLEGLSGVSEADNLANTPVDDVAHKEVSLARRASEPSISQRACLVLLCVEHWRVHGS